MIRAALSALAAEAFDLGVSAFALGVSLAVAHLTKERR